MPKYGQLATGGANKRLGQHFLNDQHIIADIIATLAPQQDDHLLEIGPGQAALTEPLMASGASLRAVEIDSRLATELRSRWPELDLIEADVLRLELADLLSGQQWRLIGNLPYNIASELLTRLAAVADRFIDGLFMLQEEVALRIAAPPGVRNRGRLSVWMQYHFEVELLFAVPPSAFQPEPAVNSRMLRLRPVLSPPPLADKAQFELILKAAFGQKRKRLSNALKSIADYLPTPRITEFLEQVGIAPERRAETLTVAEFVALTNASLAAPTATDDNLVK